MSKKCVLLIEDDAWLRDSFQTTLEHAGYEVTVAGNALTALDEIDRRRPDAIVLDVFLPGPNGLQLLHEMRTHPDLGTIPAVIVTTSAEYFTDTDMASYGVVRVLDKTRLRPHDLVAAVGKALV